jgi:CheY-like chemotaxis protein
MTLSADSIVRTVTRSLTRAGGRPAARPRILVVDDEAGIRAFLTRALSRVECELVVAASGSEAVDLFDRAAPIDLLLTDLLMPGMNGLELGRRLRQQIPDLPVVYLTGDSDALFDERPVLGANETFVDKPISFRGLHEAISLALYGRIGRLIPRERAEPAAPAPSLLHAVSASTSGESGNRVIG